MRTRIVLKGAKEEIHPDTCPSIDTENRTICLIDAESNVVSGDFDFAEITQIIFEPNAE